MTKEKDKDNTFNAPRLLRSLGFVEAAWATPSCDQIFRHPEGYSVQFSYDDNIKRNNCKYFLIQDPFFHAELSKFDAEVNVVIKEMFEKYRKDNVDNNNKYSINCGHYTTGFGGYLKTPDFDENSIEGWLEMFEKIGWDKLKLNKDEHKEEN